MEKALGLLERIFNSQYLECIKFFPGNGCKLPAIPGHYMAQYLEYDSNLVFQFPLDFHLIPESLLHAFSGKYRMQAQLIADDGRELCWKWTADIILKHT